MIRVLRDPTGLLNRLSTPGGIGFLAGGGGALDALSAFGQAQTRASASRADAKVAQIQGDRALRDYEIDSARQMARVLAVAGAGGLSLDAAGLIQSAAGELSRGRTRIEQDTKMRVSSLLRSSRTARTRAFGNFFSDLGSAGFEGLDAYETARAARTAPGG